MTITPEFGSPIYFHEEVPIRQSLGRVLNRDIMSLSERPEVIAQAGSQVTFEVIGFLYVCGIDWVNVRVY